VLLAYSGTGKREYLAVLLESGGYDVTTCNDGRDALARVETGSFDLVVTGIVMPLLDGLELVQALRRRLAAPPVIAISDGKDKMDQIYLKNAALFGAAATHTLCETGKQLLKTVDWILRDRDDARTNVV
jgi:CheY-like chemotaxis protein